MKNIFIIFLTTIFFASCKKDLNGHWHAKGLDNNNQYILDIENDSICHMITSLRSEPYLGKHFSDKRRVEIYGQNCGIYNFNYKVKGEYLIVFNHYNEIILNSLGEKITFERKPLCNKINDYKTELKIDFLRLNNLVKDSVYNSDLNQYINIGFSKEKNNLKIESLQLEGLKTINQIDSLVCEIEKNSPKQYIPFINYVLTPDQNITGKKFNEIISILNKDGKKKIYIRTLKNNFTVIDRDIFEYISLNRRNLNFDSNKTLNEIIKNYLNNN